MIYYLIEFLLRDRTSFWIKLQLLKAAKPLLSQRMMVMLIKRKKKKPHEHILMTTTTKEQMHYLGLCILKIVSFRKYVKVCVLVAQWCPTLWDPMDCVARQAPLSMGFPRQKYWNGLPFPSPGDLPDPGIELVSPALAGGFFTTEPPGKPTVLLYSAFFHLRAFSLNIKYSQAILRYAWNWTIWTKVLSLTQLLIVTYSHYWQFLS